MYATTTNAGYYVYHGLTITAGPIWVNQDVYCDAWVSLGTYPCYADGLDFVAMGDGTLETAGTTNIGFDAIAWVK